VLHRLEELDMTDSDSGFEARASWNLLLATFEGGLQAPGMPLSERPEVDRLDLETVVRLGFDS
jgi:hypothetical protein